MKLSFVLSFFLLGSVSHAKPRVLASWLENEVEISRGKIIQSISRPDTAPGAVIASPSKSEPNYFFHWVRDAALTASALVHELEIATDKNLVRVLNDRIVDYIEFSKKNQLAHTLTGLGEPKFYVDGQPYHEPWGRPQNDGPALRAIALIEYAEFLLNKNQTDYVKKELFDSRYPSQSVIKRDLEYVASHWSEPSFDLWEEVLADHFYTKMVQRKALLKGAQLARTLGDRGAAEWYTIQAVAIEDDLVHFWQKDKDYIAVSLNWKAGASYKDSALDTAVVLAALHGNMNDGFYDFSDSRVVKTMNKIVQTFAQLYPINQGNHFPGVAVGRYPEDQYSGTSDFGGNPWVLTTLAMAEGSYRMAIAAKELGRSSKLAGRLIDIGDSFILRVKTHANPDGSLSEQIHRQSGYMTSAVDLTWNYVAVLSAFRARNEATQD